MRVLLATEGYSDESVASALLTKVLGRVAIVPKRFPARGINALERALTATVRAGHQGLFDLLVVHFDLDGSIATNFQSVAESIRYQRVRAKIDEAVGTLPFRAGIGPLKTVLMTPAQSTDSWIAWGRENKDGRKWERKSRHELKRKLFGDPPRGVKEKSAPLANGLVSQMRSNPQWPISLREFIEDLRKVL